MLQPTPLVKLEHLTTHSVIKSALLVRLRTPLAVRPLAMMPWLARLLVFRLSSATLKVLLMV
jgi:hypothetical protein